MLFFMPGDSRGRRTAPPDTRRCALGAAQGRVTLARPLGRWRLEAVEALGPQGPGGGGGGVAGG